MFSFKSSEKEKEQLKKANKQQHLKNMLECPHFGIDALEQKGTTSASVIVANTALHMKQNNIQSITTQTHELRFLDDVFTITKKA